MPLNASFQSNIFSKRYQKLMVDLIVRKDFPSHLIKFHTDLKPHTYKKNFPQLLLVRFAPHLSSEKDAIRHLSRQITSIKKSPAPKGCRTILISQIYLFFCYVDTSQSFAECELCTFDVCISSFCCNTFFSTAFGCFSTH